MKKTYADLLKFLQTLTPEQLQQTATVHLTGIVEFYGINSFDVSTEETDVVDPNSVLLLVHDAE